MSRLLRIAVREYVSYVRTVGFWLSLLLAPVALAAAALAPALVSLPSAAPRLVVIDLTGEAIGQALIANLGEAPPAGLPFIVVSPPPDVRAAGDAHAAAAVARRILSRNAEASAGRRPFDIAAILSGAGDAVSLDLWTNNLNDNQTEELLRDRLAEVLRHHRLIAAGVRPEVLAAADAAQPRVSLYSPRAAGRGRVSLRDRLPSVAGVLMGILLWSVIFTGAGLLLNSVIEEKGNRILEVLLSSASVSEIMGGKILGGAAVTATVLGLWATVATAALAVRAPDLGGDVAAALLQNGLIVYFALYLVIGYLMYASIFAGIGAFCETSRDAQTLLGPLMLTLTIPIIFMGQAAQHPDAPLLQTLSWIPPFTPFLMVARIASHPPLWQVAGTLALMIVTSATVVWLSGRAFRAGALSFGKIDRRAVFAAFTGRRI
jgi:ABC-2 type transport system permease protein